MKPTTLFLALVLATGSAWAEWVKLGTAPGATYYIDIQTVQIKGQLRSVWELTNFDQRFKDGATSHKHLVEYDCENQKVRLLEFNSFTEQFGAGDLVNSSQPTASSWLATPANSPRGAKIKLVCAK